MGLPRLANQRQSLLSRCSVTVCMVAHRYMAAHPGRWDYSQAGIPSALTEEMEQHQEARAVCLQRRKSPTNQTLMS